MIFFTSDEHYNHINQKGSGVIDYCNRPFKDINEMNEELIKRHNEVVRLGDTTYHIGDFAFKGKSYNYSYETLRNRLRGNHIFLNGSHDRGNPLIDPKITTLEIKINGQSIFLNHYAQRRWAKSHYGSWHLFGHSHGTLESYGYSFDVGVDTNNFYPYSFDQIKERMSKIIVTEYQIRKGRNSDCGTIDPNSEGDTKE